MGSALSFSSMLRFIRTLLTLLAVLSAGMSLSSCGLMRSPEPLKAEYVMYEWYDDAGPGKVAININLTEQKATYTRGGRDIGWSYVATGKEGHGTTPGKYKVTEKIIDKHSSKYGWIEDMNGNMVNGDAQVTTPVPPGCRYVPAPMPYWHRITNYGIGLHAGIIPKPGETASHGCIRLPKDLAPVLFEVTEVGTPVTITN
jgi:lipoprotein-anchoring transpeptidase ErfK/SrfK